MTWQVEESGSRSGEWNMRRDETLAMDLLAGHGRPTLRFYGWQPWAVSLGWHQPAADVNAARAAEQGIDIVRRPTGGRAILHADELTYCVVCPLDGRHPSELYGSINGALLRGLALIGLRATLQASHSLERPSDRQPLSAVCFSSAARSEIKVDGRKLVGSAQRRYRSSGGNDVLLQHGSILCGPGHEGLVDFLTRVPDERRNELKRELLSRTVTLRDLMGSSMDHHELAAAFLQGFAETWSTEFEPVCAPGSSSVAVLP